MIVILHCREAPACLSRLNGVVRELHLQDYGYPVLIYVCNIHHLEKIGKIKVFGGPSSLPNGGCRGFPGVASVESPLIGLLVKRKRGRGGCRNHGLAFVGLDTSALS
jgi:hypothetical protein